MNGSLDIIISLLYQIIMQSAAFFSPAGWPVVRHILKNGIGNIQMINGSTKSIKKKVLQR